MENAKQNGSATPLPPPNHFDWQTGCGPISALQCPIKNVRPPTLFHDKCLAYLLYHRVTRQTEAVTRVCVEKKDLMVFPGVSQACVFTAGPYGKLHSTCFTTGIHRCPCVTRSCSNRAIPAPCLSFFCAMSFCSICLSTPETPLWDREPIEDSTHAVR